MSDAFESLLIEAQAKQTETLVDHLAADFVGLTVSLGDLGTRGLFNYWFSHHLPDRIAATITIHHPSVLIRPLGLSPTLIHAHGCSSAVVAEQVAQHVRQLNTTQWGVALSEYNVPNRCFYLGISQPNHTESVLVPIPEKPEPPSLETVLGSATLLHYYMRRVRNRRSNL